MKRHEYLTIPQLARWLGISRVTVYKKVRRGKIKAERIGRIYAIPMNQASKLIGKKLSPKKRGMIDTVVRKVIREYGETLRLLAQDD
jgi:excisionase family DNA binding protein